MQLVWAASLAVAAAVGGIACENGVCPPLASEEDAFATLQVLKKDHVSSTGFNATQSCRDGPLKELYSLWNNVGPTGGVNIHTFAFQPGLTEELRDRPPTLRDFTDCAPENRHTCSAWSMMRRDMAPETAFVLPNLGFSERISVLADSSKMKHMFGGLSVVDGDTDNRNACSYEGENNGGLYFSVPKAGEAGFCLSAAMTAAGVQDGDAVFRVAFDEGSSLVDNQCSDGDDRCRFINSGGCQVRQNFLMMPGCTDPSDPEFNLFSGCSIVAEAVDQESAKEEILNFCQSDWTGQCQGQINASFPGKIFHLAFGDSCPACKDPFVCTLEGPAAGLRYNSDKQQFESQVGPDGAFWSDLFFGSVGPNTFFEEATYPYSCKFLPGDFDAFIGAYRNFLETTISTNAANTAMLANPGNEQSFNNEINLYIQPDPFSDAYRAQEEQLFDAVLGWSIDLRTCEEKLAFLDDVASTFPAESSNGVNVTVTTAVQRCEEIFKSNDMSLSEEQKTIDEAKSAIVKINAQFEKRLGRKLPIFSTKFIPSNAVSLSDFQKALDNNVSPGPFFDCYT